jgi:hypothetical protein
VKVDLLHRDVEVMLDWLAAGNPFETEKQRTALRDKLQAAVIKADRHKRPRKRKDEVTFEQWCSYFDEIPGLISWDTPTTRATAQFQYWTPWRQPFMLKVREAFAKTNKVYTPYDLLVRTISKPNQLEYLAKYFGKGTRPLQL